MTPNVAMRKPVSSMSIEELKYTTAYCDGEVRRCALNSNVMDKYEKRRQEAERELRLRKD